MKKQTAELANFLNAIGKNLRAHRVRLNIPLEVAARELGASTGYLHKVEARAVDLRLDFLAKVCQLYRINLAELLATVEGDSAIS